MSLYLKSTVKLLIGLLLLLCTVGLSNDLSLFEQDLPKKIKEALEEFRNTRVIEKIYIHTD